MYAYIHIICTSVMHRSVIFPSSVDGLQERPKEKTTGKTIFSHVRGFFAVVQFAVRKNVSFG